MVPSFDARPATESVGGLVLKQVHLSSREQLLPYARIASAKSLRFPGFSQRLVSSLEEGLTCLRVR